ncbi:cornifelin homolog [Leucoraja erinacea]|uniref:cornifelin homolog n=1 Tax=Leucoraja erinaceus TaxID=7782 RepID=UPI0024566F8E|nr:cornifelin homolog [Leucoraja erinacea]
MASTTTVVVHQPVAVGNRNGQWSSGQCGVCDDMTVCTLGFFCPMFLGCYLADRYGENCCVAMLPGGMVALRTHMRLSYGIQGSICEDAMLISCCPVCEYCRMAREMRIRQR